MREHDVVGSRYRIERRLAAGGFGAIYAATDLVMGREVALKVLHRELAHDAQVVARFRREADALARLRDPHTVTMYDVGADADGTPYIVLELLRGETLYQQFLNEGPLPWRRVASIARGVCSSLREAHAAGIIHRDLKPANIHLEITSLQQDHVKVLDFGIAKLVDAAEHAAPPDLTLAGQMIGTFDYMPPEQLIGGQCTGKSDVFALAVMMYEMIAGELPYGTAHGPAGRLMTILSTTPTPLVDRAPFGVPPMLDAIVMRALSHEIEERPDMEELDAVLIALLEGSKPIKVMVPTDINSLIDEVLTENAGDSATMIGAPPEDDDADDGTFPPDDADTWVGSPPQTTTIGLAPTRAPSPNASDIATLMKPLGKREIPRAPSFEAQGTGKVSPLDTNRTARSPSPSPSPSPSSRFAVGSRTEISPSTVRRVTPAHIPPPPPRRTPPHASPVIGSSQTTGSQRPTPSQAIGSERSTPSKASAVDPLASTMSPHLHIDARTADSQAQTARQPRRVLTPPSGTTTSAASARAEIERLAHRSQMPVVRIATPSGRAGSGGFTGTGTGAASRDALTSPAHRMWKGRPTPSEHALPPAPHMTPSGELPTMPSRMATGTSPIVNKPAGISMARVVVWTLALFGVGFAAALGIAAL